MPDTLKADAPSAPLLTIPDALASEAAAVMLSGDPGALKAVQGKMAAALAGQGLPAASAGTLVDGWMHDFTAGLGAQATPDAAIAQANRIAAGAAARMAQATQEAASLSGEQRLATALAQGQGAGTPSLTAKGTASDLSAALFNGVMDPLARPAGAADPIAALSQALNAPPSPTATPAAAPLSPAEQLTAALASGSGVQQAVKAVGAGQNGHFADTLERALSSGADSTAAVTAAKETSASSEALAHSTTVGQSDGARMLAALSSGGVESHAAVSGAAFASVLNDALTQGGSPDAALAASVRAQTEMTASQNAAVVPPKPTDALVASLASGRNVGETVKSFASAAGIDPSAAGGFGQALGSALSTGHEPAGALGTARQDVAAASSLSAETAKGVKADPLVAALASGQNVQQAVQALGGTGAAFSAALGQALAEGRPAGQALAAARQAADTVQQNTQASEVPVSAQDKAIADLANPDKAAAPKETGEGKQAAKDAGQHSDSADGKTAEQVADAQTKDDGGKEKDGKDSAKADDKGDAKADAKESTGEKAAPDASADGKPTPPDASSPPAAKQAALSDAVPKAISFDLPGTTDKSTAASDGATHSAASTDARPAISAPSVTKALSTSDAFAVAAQSQQRAVQSVVRAVENTTSDTAGATTPTVAPTLPATPTVPAEHHAAAPTLSASFDAAALAKALAIAEGTAAPAGFTVFHLIEAMFRPGETGSSVVGVAVVANQGSQLGIWQYSVDGNSWSAVGSVAETAALVLPSNALLRFLPAAGASGQAPALELRAVGNEWTGGFSGTEHRLFTLGGTGGTTPLSSDVATLSIDVTSVNGAPVATGVKAVLDAVAEDSDNPAGATVSTLFGKLFSDPSDAVFGASGDHFAGVAVVANPGSSVQGEWQYWNGGSWVAVGAASDSNALLLSAETMLRFLPAANWNGQAPSLMVRLVDDSAGAIVSGDHVDLKSVGVGGTTPYSVSAILLDTRVTAVNDAPTATGTTATLAHIAEDSVDATGTTVSTLFGGLFSDATDAVTGGSAANGFAGVLVVGNAATATEGSWQYWTGTSWADIGTASAGNGLLLAAGTALRFLPTADWNGTTPALTVRLVDDSLGAITSGERVTVTAGGGTGRYSAGTIALTGSVDAVNDAPVATGTTATLAHIAEDSVDATGTTVSTLFGSLFSDATDAVTGGSSANGFAGVLVVGNAATATEGSWQYWTGTSWADIGAASAGNGLLLAAGTAMRFLPTADWNGTTPALTVRLVDDSLGAITSGERVTVTAGGGTGRYSAGTIALTGSVDAVNDAPVATGTTATLAHIAEDSVDATGTTVSTLFGGLFSDATDAVTGGSTANGFAGVLVVGNAATATEGSWQYWTGTSWADIGTASAGNGLLLAAGTALRFLPTADWNGTTPALTVRLVDDSLGAITSGERVTVTAGGGTGRYSAGTIALTGSVDAVNDAPVATGTAATLPAIAEDTVDPAGATVTSLFGGLFSDAADAVTGGSSANGFAGIAIVGNAATATQGVWQYWTGTAWSAVGSVSEGSALVIATADRLRFVPSADWNGTTPALTVRLIEGGAGTTATGGHVDLTHGVGGSTVYSAETIALTGSVTPVNDAPHITAGTMSLSTVKGVAVAVTGLSVSDIDAGSTPLLVTLSAGHGTLTLANGGTDAVITGNGTDTVTIRATLGTINSLLGTTNGLLYTAASYSGADSIHVLVDDQGGGGAGGPLTASASVSVTVVPPNASPVLADTDLSLSVAGEALAAPTAGTVGIAVSKLVGLSGSGPANVTDGDAGAVTGIALVGTNETYGHWWFSTDGGSTWSLVGAVNNSDSALLLRSTDRLYFQPNASVPSTVNGALTIHAWDQTSGTAGTKVTMDTSTGSAFSTATDSVTLHPGVLIPNGSFDNGLTGWTYTGGTTIGTTGDGHEATLTSASGQTPTQLEDFLSLAHGSIATATGTVPSAGHAMKLGTTVTVTQDTTLTFDWSFIFSDPGYHDFAFVSVNGVVTLLAKEASASGTFSVVVSANSTLSLGFGTSDTGDNSVNPILRVDNIKLTTVASDPIVLDMTGHGLELRPLSDGIHFDVTGDGVADSTGWIGTGNALLVQDSNGNGRIDDAHELVSEQFGSGFNSSLEALASLDRNHDGRLDATDEAFATLKVWQDANGDGVSQATELRGLAEAGIRSIATTATPSDATLAGSRILGTTSMTMADGSSHAVAGVAFDVKAASAAQIQIQPQATASGTNFTALLTSGLGSPAEGTVVPQDAFSHLSDSTAALHAFDQHHSQNTDIQNVHHITTP